MNREILFRGKRLHGGRSWVYGSLIQGPDASSIWSIELKDDVEVDPATIGQYTGLTDKNGVKIFEGDIVQVFGHIGTVTNECGAYGVAIIPHIDWNCFEQEIKPVTRCDNAALFCFNDNYVSLWELMWNYNLEDSFCEVAEILGNIHDSPELLQEAPNAHP